MTKNSAGLKRMIQSYLGFAHVLTRKCPSLIPFESDSYWKSPQLTAILLVLMVG
jgi:hypothetical protein